MRSFTSLLCAMTVASAVAGPLHAETAKTILFLAEDVPSGLDLDGASASITTSQTGMVNIMEPLFGYATKGVNASGITVPDFSKFEGRLVESWAFDPKTLIWTLHLRHGVKGCTGNEFTAKDVVYTYERGKSVSGSTPVGWFLANVASVKGFTADVFKNPAARTLSPDEVKAVDDYTVTIAQSEPNALFLPVLTIFGTYIFDATLMKAHATDKDPWAHDFANNVSPASFGPYCVERWEKNQEIIFKANPNYWRGKPAIDRVIMRRVPQSSNRMVILRTGQAQLTQNLTPREFDSLRGAPGLKVEGVEGNESLFIIMNFKIKPFDNIKLRQAIAYAIPTEQIIKTGYFGQAKPWHSIVPSIYPGYAETPTQYPYDTAKAKATLADAGYPDGKGLEAFHDSFQLTYPAEKESTVGPIVNIIQSALRQVGIPATLNPIPLAQFGDRTLVKRDLPFALNDYDKAIGVDAGYTLQLFLVSANKGGIANESDYSNAYIDETWPKARVETDPAKRNALLADMQEQAMKDVALLPIVEFKTQYALSDKLTGLSWQSDSSERFFDLKLQ